MKPNLFVVGAAKAGTTSIVNYLSQYEKVFVPPIKEPHFFGEDFNFEAFSQEYKRRYKFDSEAYFSNDKLEEKHICFIEKIEDYLSLYSKAENAFYAVDGSTGYLYSETASKDIYKFNPEAKIIIILRNPVERALSHYYMLLGNGNENELDPIKAFKRDFNSSRKGFGISHLYIEMGCYYEQIRRYFDVFDPEKILVLDFKDLKNDIKKIERQLADFIEEDTPLPFNEAMNATLIPKLSFIKNNWALRKNIRQLIPKPIKDKIKETFLFRERPNTFKINNDITKFLEERLDTDWKKTLCYLSEKKIFIKPKL